MSVATSAGLLIRNATLRNGRHVDVRIAEGRICEMGDLGVGDTPIFDAGGGLLIPGLHDHHMHVAATAAALESVRCGPPQVTNAAALRAALAKPGEKWLRGIGYHESIAGMIDRHWLDHVETDRPIRVQHRSGRMWFFNTAGIDALLTAKSDAAVQLERDATGFTGRLFDGDAWLRSALGTVIPSFRAIGVLLSRFGITGVTDMTVSNDRATAAHFAAEQRSDALPQRVVMAGSHDLAIDTSHNVAPYKIHLHEAHLPDFDLLVADIQRAHGVRRAVAVHCVTLVELVYTIAALEEAGVMPGDRIEHASIATPELVGRIADLGLAVVTQPNFVYERGEAYLRDLPSADWPHLYRLRSWRDHGVPLGGGTDAPFGEPDPWAAMAAAVARRTDLGTKIGGDEALSADEALDLFLADPHMLSMKRTVAVGAPADICLLNQPWAVAKTCLSADLVAATLIGGKIVYDRVHQSVDQHRATPVGV